VAYRIKPRILVVDDDPQVVNSINDDLRSRFGRDYQVDRATSGQEALDLLADEPDSVQPVALLLSDQRMPGLDGVQFLVQARALAPSAKRALLTAYAETDAAIAAINQSKVDHYLQKPWEPSTLLPIIDGLLKEWRAAYKPGLGGIRIIGSRWMPTVHELREFLARNQVPYEFFDVEAGDESGKEMRELAAAAAALPLVITESGERLANPPVFEVARRAGLKTKADRKTYDVAIVGAGPAGLAAAVYSASEGLATVLLDRDTPGGQAGTSSLIENYLGFEKGVSGQQLTDAALRQAEKFEVETLNPVDVLGLRIDLPYKHLQVGSGPAAREISCKALVLTMGLKWQRLPADCAERFENCGIYYGSAMTASCLGETVYIVGAGNSAGQAAMNLQAQARKVVMVVRGQGLEERMSEYLVRRIRSTPNIEVLTRTEVTACRGNSHLEGLTIRHRDTRAATDVDARYLFVFIGATPQTEWLGESVARDAHGFILTGSDLDRARDLRAWPLDRAPFLLEANVPGVFAAGDVRHESVKRVASAVGEGSVAVHFIHRYLASL
jgi:thioredoxin reductase (NADPH)